VVKAGTHLKAVDRLGDERWCGEILEAFDGRGCVRVLEYTDQTVLMERVEPGDSLAALAVSGRDDEATRILTDVIRRMSPNPPPPHAVPVADLARAFGQYLESGHAGIPRLLVDLAQQTYAGLCASQGQTRLLHGDLHHYNVLRDDTRGWIAIDPKGLIGELEYELGAALRNPIEAPHLFASRDTFERRLTQFGAALGLDTERIRRWAFAQAVLAAIWSVEDGAGVEMPLMELARVIQPTIAP
jgi:streptomycin 6-kinase